MNAPEKAPGKLDWSAEFTPAEYDRILAHYTWMGGPDAADRYRFVRFMQKYRPDALKRWRLVVNSVTEGLGLEDPLPCTPYLCFVVLHFYCILPYPYGIRTDLEVAKLHGAKRAEVVDMLAVAWIHAGTLGMNVSSRVAEEFLETWDADDGAPGVTWPEDWTVDPSAFQCGINFEASNDLNEITVEDLRKIEEWHLRIEGEVPDYVGFLATHYPLSLRVFRARFENSMCGGLPKQLIALCLVHVAAVWKRPDALRRALHMARVFNVSRDHVVQVIAFAQQYSGHLAMDASIVGADDILKRWN